MNQSETKELLATADRIATALEALATRPAFTRADGDLLLAVGFGADPDARPQDFARWQAAMATAIREVAAARKEKETP